MVLAHKCIKGFRCSCYMFERVITVCFTITYIYGKALRFARTRNERPGKPMTMTMKLTVMTVMMMMMMMMVMCFFLSVCVLFLFLMFLIVKLFWWHMGAI